VDKIKKAISEVGYDAEEVAADAKGMKNYLLAVKKEEWLIKRFLAERYKRSLLLLMP